MTLTAYYAAYKSLLGGLAAAVTVSPLVSMIPLHADPYIFPPLGEIDMVSRVITVAAILLATFVVLYLNPRDQIRAIIISTLLFLGCAICYAICFSLFVRTISIPAKDTSVSFSIGMRRTEFAKKQFPDNTDQEILRYRGLSEEEVQRCWTPASLLAARLLLWLSCTFSLVFLVASFGFGILASNENTSSP